MRRLGVIFSGVIVGSALVSTFGLATAAGSVFLTRAPGGGVECGLVDAPGPTYNHQVFCESHRLHKLLLQEAKLTPDGQVVICIEHGVRNPYGCNFGNAGEGTPTYRSGKRVTVGRFRCVVLRTGVKCLVIATGQGFLMTLDKVIPVGGATVRTPPLHLSEFRSPDGKIGCLISEAVPPGYDILCNALSGHPREAGISKSGEVSVCNQSGSIGVSSCGLGFPKGPVLAYGQQTEVGGFTCRSATDGIICTKVSGVGSGKGFRINTNEAVSVA